MEPIKSHSLPQTASHLFVGQESITTYQRSDVNSCKTSEIINKEVAAAQGAMPRLFVETGK